MEKKGAVIAGGVTVLARRVVPRRLHLANENLTRFAEKFLPGDTRLLSPRTRFKVTRATQRPPPVYTPLPPRLPLTRCVSLADRLLHRTLLTSDTF